MKCLVTGGAGFIGSHVVDRLLKDDSEVVIYDNFSTGKKEFISHHKGHKSFKVIQADLQDTETLTHAMAGCDFVFHLAAHADVRSGINDHFIDHQQNLEMTQNVLEVMYKNSVKNIMFASTSSVYGDATVHPTPENYPHEPTSLYGATKAACESYIRAYTSYYDFNFYIFRFVSFIGERYTHGIVYDVLKKLQTNPHRLELFSDGTPQKSSIYVGDGIDAIFKVIKESDQQQNIFNIGHDEVTTVSQIVDWIIEAGGFSGVEKIWLGKESNWKGDNTFVQLSNQKLKSLGWAPALTIREGIFKTTRYILENKLF